MDPDKFREVAKIEERYWWHVARRRILQKVLDSLGLRPGARLLEAGCGSGGNLSLLARFGELHAFEPDDLARAMANRRAVIRVEKGALPSAVPFAGPFDLIVMLDVLEHIDDDVEALLGLRRHLGEGGRLLLTVPAFAALWSHHDVIAHHRRRYSLSSLQRTLQSAGFAVEYATYFNSLLFPLVYLAKKAGNFSRPRGGDRRVPPSPLNRLLTAVFASERFLLPRCRLPFGVSALVVAHPVSGDPPRPAA